MLNDAKFSDNGGCGYILKPDFLREPNPKYSPILSSTSTFLHPKKLKITIISGQCMPGSSSNGENNVIRPYVRVNIFGHPMEYDDLDQKYHTSIVENNSFNPFWNEVVSIEVKLPALAFLQLSVHDKKSLTNVGEKIIKDPTLGSFIAPINMLSQGKIYEKPKLILP